MWRTTVGLAVIVAGLMGMPPDTWGIERLGESEVSQLRAEVQRLQAENAKLQAELRATRGQSETPVSASPSKAPSGPVTPTNAPTEQGEAVSLRDVLIRAESFARPVNDQSTSVLKNDAFNRAFAQIQQLLERAAAIRATGIIKDVKEAGNGTVVIRTSGMAGAPYGDPKNLFLSCSAADEWPVRMDAELARQLKPETPITVIGKAVFTSREAYHQPAGKGKKQLLVNMYMKPGIAYGSITMTDYKVQIGKLTFDSPYTK